MSNHDHEKQFAAEFTASLLSLARAAERVGGPDATFTAFLSTAISYAISRGVSEEGIRAHLRELADRLELTEPPAPVIN